MLGCGQDLHQKLIAAMVGRELTQMYPPKNAKIGETILKVKNISKEGYFKNVSFDVRKGEILALTVWLVQVVQRSARISSES